MTTWILLGCAIYLAGLFLPSSFLILQIGLNAYVGSRDAEPGPSLFRGRALRAQRNLLESMVLFLGLGAMNLVVPEADVELATSGAQIFVVARLAYLPLYLFAVPWIRSGAWAVGFLGLILMAMALI